VDRLKNIPRSKGGALFALIDHSGEAAKVGMKTPPTKLLIFGNPKGGPPLMLAAPSVALDLPLKILVSEDAQGKVWLSYNSPQYLKERHGLSSSPLPNIAVIETLATKAGEWYAIDTVPLRQACDLTKPRRMRCHLRCLSWVTVVDSSA